ncbi:alpha/beta fold hydrolase [Burkholderia cenocepacia]|uniref:alpha/beta fold hydrolase n=1 Tax=Burkholderia cenocepacia TaxID=95486 RepID=UPI003D160391
METHDTATPQADHPVFVLVHGAWHGAWCYAHVAAALAARGYLSIARDLPAHGIHARFPASYLARPLDQDAFGAEPSPVANTTLDEYATQVMQAVDDAYALGRGKVVLVGHSMGGLAITAAAERAPEKIAKIVYLAAFMPASGVPGLDYVRAPENQGELLAPPDAREPACGWCAARRSAQRRRRISRTDEARAVRRRAAGRFRCGREPDELRRAGRAVRDRDPDDRRPLGRARPSLHQVPAGSRDPARAAAALHRRSRRVRTRQPDPRAPARQQPLAVRVAAGRAGRRARRHREGLSRAGAAGHAYATDRSRPSRFAR